MINARETCKKWVQVLMINYIISLFVRVKTLFSFCWNSIPCLTRKKILLYQNFSSFSSPHAFISLFHSVTLLQNTWKPTNMKQADKTSIYKITLYKFFFHMYIRIRPLVVFFSFRVRYNVYAPFTKIWF